MTPATSVELFLLDELENAVANYREKQEKVAELSAKLKQAAVVVEAGLLAQGINARVEG